MSLVVLEKGSRQTWVKVQNDWNFELQRLGGSADKLFIFSVVNSRIRSNCCWDERMTLLVK